MLKGNPQEIALQIMTSHKINNNNVIRTDKNKIALEIQSNHIKQIFTENFAAKSFDILENPKNIIEKNEIQLELLKLSKNLYLILDYAKKSIEQLYELYKYTNLEEALLLLDKDPFTGLYCHKFVSMFDNVRSNKKN